MDSCQEHTHGSDLPAEVIIVANTSDAKLLAAKVAIEQRINQYNRDIAFLNNLLKKSKTSQEMKAIRTDIRFIESFIDELQKILILL